MTPELQFGSPAFEDGTTIPERYTCEGDDVSPPLFVEDVPAGAESLALVVDDPDAPGGSFTHWLVWNLPPDIEEIPEGIPPKERIDDLGDASQGTNDFDEVGYRGPCPPEGGGEHTYRFRLYVLDDRIGIGPGARKSDFTDVIMDYRMDTVEFTGRSGR